MLPMVKLAILVLPAVMLTDAVDTVVEPKLTKNENTICLFAPLMVIDADCACMLFTVADILDMPKLGHPDVAFAHADVNRVYAGVALALGVEELVGGYTVPQVDMAQSVYPN